MYIKQLPPSFYLSGFPGFIKIPSLNVRAVFHCFRASLRIPKRNHRQKTHMNSNLQHAWICGCGYRWEQAIFVARHTPPKTNMAKLMVGRPVPFGMEKFQGRTVKLQGRIWVVSPTTSSENNHEAVIPSTSDRGDNPTICLSYIWSIYSKP